MGLTPEDSLGGKDISLMWDIRSCQEMSALLLCAMGAHSPLQAGHSGTLNTKFITDFTLKYQHCSVSFLPFCIPVALHKAKFICVPSPRSSLYLAAPAVQSSVHPVGQEDVSVLGAVGTRWRTPTGTTSPLPLPAFLQVLGWASHLTLYGSS